MPKMKSHGGISKKINVRNSGSTKIGHVGANHKTNFNRKSRKGSVLSSGDAKRYRGLVK